MLAETMRRIGVELGHPVSDIEASAFSRSLAAWTPFDDTVAALRRLRECFSSIVLSNVALSNIVLPNVALSNVDDLGMRQSTDLLGLEFDAVVSAESVGSNEPAHRHFVALTELLATRNADPRRHLHVAQSLCHDIKPATDFGIATCWIDRRQDRIGYGATPESPGITTDFQCSSVADFADNAAPVKTTD